MTWSSLLGARRAPASTGEEELTPRTSMPGDTKRVVLADGHSGRARATEPLRRVTAHFAVGTALALLAITAAGYVVGGRLAEGEALRDVERVAEVVSRTLVEPHLSQELLDGDPEALAEFDQVVRERLLPGTSMQRVKLWTASGRIAYSDDSRLIDDVHPLGPEELRVLKFDETTTKVSDLSRGENLLERSLGPRLLEVYTRVMSPSGEPLIFEAYLSYDLIEENRTAILQTFAWLALMGLGVFAVFQVTLAYANVRWLHRQRARLKERAVRIADEERRRVARDLHDGVVQDLVGASYVVGGAVAPMQSRGAADIAETLRGAVGGIRRSIQGLRSMIIEIYPASLRSAGLRAALSDLVAPVQGRGTRILLDLPEDLDLPSHVEAAIFRCAQEALRNAVNHGRARTVTLVVRIRHGAAALVVRDDGIGFDPTLPAKAGHVGLQGLADLVDELGGILEITSSPGHGTQVRMELPT